VALAIAGAARAAAPVHVSLPTVVAPPGATVVIPITVDQSLAPFSITSIGYQLTLDPTRITGANSDLATGVMATWGPPFAHATSTVAASLAVGFTPVLSTSTLIQNLELTIGASVPLGTDIPLAFQSFTLNDGAPAVVLGTGTIQVRGSAAVGDARGPGFALGPPQPNPMRSSTRFSISIPDDRAVAPVRVAVFDVSGRRVRLIADGPMPAGRHPLTWDGRDQEGERVTAGSYWLDLERGGAHRRQRLVVVR
jgi:hypothetical protein